MVVRVLVITLLQEDEARLVRLPREGGTDAMEAGAEPSSLGARKGNPRKRKTRRRWRPGPGRAESALEGGG